MYMNIKYVHTCSDYMAYSLCKHIDTVMQFIKFNIPFSISIPTIQEEQDIVQDVISADKKHSQLKKKKKKVLYYKYLSTRCSPRQQYLKSLGGFKESLSPFFLNKKEYFLYCSFLQNQYILHKKIARR